jgi:hypothetical protein
MSNTQAEVVKLQQSWSLLSGMITGGAWWATDSNHALIAALICAVVDKLIACIYLEEKK